MKHECFISKWNQRSDIETDIEITKDDICTILSGYAFVIQKDGNVVFKKLSSSKFSIRDVFRMFRLFAIKNGITHIRVEGSPRKYNFLSKMFPYSHFVRDFEVKDRNVFFVKL